MEAYGAEGVLEVQLLPTKLPSDFFLSRCVTLSVESAQTDTVPWPRTPRTPSASNLVFKAWEVGDRLGVQGAPCEQGAWGKDAPLAAWRGRSGSGWSQALGANASSLRHPASGTELPGWVGPGRGTGKGTQEPRPAFPSRFHTLVSHSPCPSPVPPSLSSFSTSVPF